MDQRWNSKGRAHMTDARTQSDIIRANQGLGSWVKDRGQLKE